MLGLRKTGKAGVHMQSGRSMWALQHSTPGQLGQRLVKGACCCQCRTRPSIILPRRSACVLLSTAAVGTAKECAQTGH